jgi:hypothetical protein
VLRSSVRLPKVPVGLRPAATGRYNLLPNEMDVNAGAYLDGVPMDDLGRETWFLWRRNLGVAEKKGLWP